jgi:hypothetical protein
MKHLGLIPAICFLCIEVSAQEIYERVDKKGVVEFSDTPSTSTSDTDVKPHVVGLSQTPAGESSAINREGVFGVYYAANMKRYEVGDEGLERREVGDEGLERREVGDEGLERHEVGDEGLERR